MRKPEVFSLTHFGLLTILILISSTIAFLVAPGFIYAKVHTATWYVPFLALAPGLLYALIYQSLIAHSPYPLPRMMEHYWGRIIGWLLSLAYAVFFLIWASFWVRLFLDFQLSVINPMQPISLLLAGILIVAMYGLKLGLTTTIRGLEVIFSIVVVFQLFIIFLGGIQSDFRNLLPLYHAQPLSLAGAVLLFSRFYAATGIVLILGYFLTDGNKPGSTVRRALIITALALSAIFAVTVGVIGNLITHHAYPIFDMVRQLHIGTFIRNLDALFIAMWFVGTFFGIFILWFAFIFTLQQMFRLSDYRPLAPATVLILGVMSIQLGSSSIEVSNLQTKVMYPLLMVFMVGIPAFTWIVGLIRGKVGPRATSEQRALKG